MATIEVVHIYLLTQGAITEWIDALSIPREDIKRLTLRPLKWLRFATFTVCGAKGDFSATPGGEIVDYENVSFDNLGDKYYYTPNDMYHLVDYQAFNDLCTSSAATPRRSNFHGDICKRDGSCVITETPHELCDAAHIIPNDKGNVYITYVVRDRSSLYEQLPFSLEDDVDINCIQNGILLNKELHARFSMANVVFLKTPNFAMAPADVPRIEQGPIPHNRTTLQYMKPPAETERYVVPSWDVQADWSSDEVAPPPSILLDFMYGAAVVDHWGCDRLLDILEQRCQDDFGKVLFEYPKRSAPEDDELDDSREGKQKGRKTFSSDASAGLLKAMDNVLLLSMLPKGTTPQKMAEEWEKRNKEKERRSQEHSCEKVRQWLNLDASVRPL